MRSGGDRARLALVAVLTVVTVTAAARAGEADREPPPSQVTRLSLPFDGIWGVIQGFDSGDSHVGYAAFALDFVPAQRAGARPPPRGAPLARFACFGRPVRAPADGRVVRMAGHARDWPGYVKGKDEGNFIILEHAPGEYTEFRHLQAGSVRLALGALVRRGDLIGRCGNSGNATTPHLHVGFLSSIHPITTRPMVLSDYEVLGSDGGWIKGDGALREGDLVRAVAPQPRHP
jgi:murein DD-endopeptidase MepM/ murein hydrolase activator NlpD